MAMKNRVLCLMDFLQKNSDERHSVTTAEVRKQLDAIAGRYFGNQVA